MAEIAKIEIDKDTITSIIDKKVHAAILSELDGTKDIILSRVIDSLIKQKVDYQGKISAYNSSSDKTLLEYLVHNKIKEAMESSLKKFFEKESSKLEALLMKEIVKNKNSMVKQMAAAMISSSQSDYRWKFKIESEVKERDDDRD